jgi:hypothetical protein
MKRKREAREKRKRRKKKKALYSMQAPERGSKTSGQGYWDVNGSVCVFSAALEIQTGPFKLHTYHSVNSQPKPSVALQVMPAA